MIRSVIGMSTNWRPGMGRRTLFYASSGIEQGWTGASARESPAYTTYWDSPIQVKATQPGGQTGRLDGLISSNLRITADSAPLVANLTVKLISDTV
jgi:hypothetical protein